MRHPEVTIVSPVYNTPVGYLDDLYQSLLSQNVSWEWIAVDDGSRDPAGREWLAALAARDTRVRLEELGENQGACSARNRGLELSRSRWVKFIDSDDWLGDRLLDSELRETFAEDAEMVLSVCRVIERQEGKDRVVREHRDFDFLNPLVSAITKGFGHPGAVLFDAGRCRRIGGWNERLAADQDGDFFARYISGGVKARYNSGGFSCYREHEGERISEKVKPRSISSRVAVMCWIEDHYRGPDNPVALLGAKEFKWSKIGLLAFQCGHASFRECIEKIARYRHWKLFVVYSAMLTCSVLSFGALRELVFRLRVARRKLGEAL